ncbi:MAG TPA: DUF1097 family protein [Gemmatimonadales bacterium]|jgi:hypothetical protein|nr:DUF1097 family protein [Gemmatimonadales bacterium]
MNASTARALLVGLLVAVWVYVSVVARVNLAVWVGLVALGCSFAAGGGVPGLQKTLVGTLSGVVWFLVAVMVRDAVGGTTIVRALIFGATASGIMLLARVPLMAFTAGAFAGAGVAWAAGVNTVTEAIRVGVALAIGALIGFVAERVGGMVAARRM